MTAQILDGRAAAAAIKTELQERVARLRAEGIVPGLGTLLVGANPGSVSYVTLKHRYAHEVGIESVQIDLPETASREDILGAVA